MKKKLCAILLTSLSEGALATSQTMDPVTMMKMMQFMRDHPEMASQMMQIVNQERNKHSTSTIPTAQSVVTKVNCEMLLSEHLDRGAHIEELDLENIDFSVTENLSKVVQFFGQNRLVNLKTINLTDAKNVHMFFEAIFDNKCTTNLYSVQHIKAAHSTGLIPDHISQTLFKYIESYRQCTRDMRTWSQRHGNIIAAFIRIDVDGIDAFKGSSLWKGIKTKEIEISYRSGEVSDMAPVIIRTEG